MDVLVGLIRNLYAPCPANNFLVGAMLLQFCKTHNKEQVICTMKSNMGQSKAELINGASNELIQFSKRAFVTDFGYTLDSWMGDNDIKEFIKKYIKVYSWESCMKDHLKLCYKGYPVRKPPFWDETQIQMFGH